MRPLAGLLGLQAISSGGSSCTSSEAPLHAAQILLDHLWARLAREVLGAATSPDRDPSTRHRPMRLSVTKGAAAQEHAQQDDALHSHPEILSRLPPSAAMPAASA